MKKFLVLVLLLSGCSFKKNPLVNQTSKGHEELYSEPNEPKLEDTEDHVKRIVIAATNDIEGRFSPKVINFKDQNGKQQIKIGGADAIGSYLSILREKYGNVLLLDSGDIFSTKSNLKDIQKFYDNNKYDALTAGLGDFNLKLPTGINSNADLLREFAKTSPTKLLLSNLYDLKTARVVEWKGTSPYLLKEINGVKVGVIGLVPDDIATLTPVDNRVGLYVESMLQSTLRQARLLRSLGANIVVVLTHQGVTCGQDIAREAKLPLSKVNFEPRKPGVCDRSSQLGIYLERLPPHLVDVVIGGRNHQKTANYINETLVLSGFEHGQSFSYAEFYVDTKDKKLLREKTVVHQPVMICREFFKETKDCYYEDPSVNHKERIPPTFLGNAIGLEQDKVALVRDQGLHKIDIEEALKQSASDIAYFRETSKDSQLMSLKIEGAKLIKILEQDYNKDEGKYWSPSPFRLEGKELYLSVKGEPINLNKTYTVLSDLEAIQTNRVMKKSIHSKESKAHMSLSWSSFSDQDTIATKLSAQAR